MSLRVFTLIPIGETLPAPICIVLETPIIPGYHQDAPIFSTQAGAELCVEIGRTVDDQTVREIELFTSRGGRGLRDFRKWQAGAKRLGAEPVGGKASA